MDTLKTAALCTMKYRLHRLVPFFAMALSLTATTSHAAVLLDAPGHAAVEGARVAASGGEPGAAWTILDWCGRETGVSGIFDEEGKAELPLLPTGYYRMMKVQNGKPTTASLATLAVVSPPLVTRHSSLVTDDPASAGPFFGADCAIDELFSQFDCPWNGGDAVRTVADLAQMAGFTHVRGRHNWARMQPSSEKSPDSDRLVANAALFRERGIGVSGLLYGTPAWAGRLQKLPGDLAAIYRSCREIAAAFGDNVMDWEFFNEPDIGFAPEPVWDYAAAFKAASLGFKAANPNRPVLCAGLCQSPKGVYLKTFLENDAAPYFDIFNYHTYSAPTQYHALIAEMRATLATVGAGDRPIWMTECGTNFEGPATEESVRKGFKAHSPEQELVVAEFAPKSQIAMMMEGAERNFFFILAAYSERGGGKDWGLIRRDGTVKPAYAALATIARELGDATLAGSLDVGTGLRAYLFDHPDGTQTVAFWAESPLDSATNGQTVMKPDPDYARTGLLRGAAPAKDSLSLIDMCGKVSAIAPDADGTLALPATRFPAYVSGLRGLRANDSSLVTRHSSLDARHSSLAPTVVYRVDLTPGDFEVSNNKTLAVAKTDEPHLRVQIWNLSEAAKAGTIEVAGARLVGLPDGPITLSPFGKAEFDCVLKPEDADGTWATANTSTLTLSGTFDGQPASRLTMPVFFENLFLASCVTVPLDWKDPAKWTRNDSADEYSVTWDEAEQALRFDVAWKNPGVGRWFYPVLKLPADGPNLAGGLRVAFEVKTAQDKMENDFGECCLMLVRGKKGGSPAEWLRYFSPTGSWEQRHAELSSAKDLHEVDAIRLGANPRGMRLTFWVRNIVVLKAASPNSASFYRVERDAAGAWRLIDPAGEPTVWLGVDHVKFDGFRCEADGNRKHYREANLRQFGTPEAWATNTAARLRSWGFNGLGAGCNNAAFKGSGLGRCVFLALGDSATAEKADEEHWLSDNLHTPGTAFPNVFNPDFAEHCDREAEKACAPNRDDPEVLGYFIDNELAWEARRGGPAGEWGLYDNAARKPAGNSARKALEEFLGKYLAQSPQSSQSDINAETQGRGDSPIFDEQSSKKTSRTSRTLREEISASLRLCIEKGDLLAVPVEVKMAFVEYVADKYFEITTAAIRRHDPNHLVLGCRFAGTIYPDEVFRAAGKYCDIVSINGYAEPIPDRNEMVLSYRGRYYLIAETFSKIGAVAGRPIMLTEWSFPAFDSGLPCLRGVGKRFDTQQERAWATALYARSVLSSPWVIGYDYFMWVDMPAKGISFRFPEDANYGLVREDGTEYPEITQAFAAIQRRDGLDFDAWRKQLQTRGPQEPPPWTPLLMVDYLDGEYIPVTNSTAKPPTFDRYGDSWRVENAAGLTLLSPSRREERNTETRRGEENKNTPCLQTSVFSVIGAAGTIASLSWRGLNYGSLSAEITARGVFDPKNPDGYVQKTHRVERVASATWRVTDEGRGILALDCDFGVARMALEIGIAPESSCLHVDVRRIENTGGDPLEITDIALLPDAPFPEATVPPKMPRPGFMMRPHCTRAWIDRATGRTLGVLTDSAFANVIDFAADKDARRSAVRFTPGRPIHGSKQLLLAPGEAWTPEAPLHMLLRLGDSGEEDWNAFSKKRPKTL